MQHAHNPVDWYPWGDEALNKAKTENKPVLVSIGYAACHWCHVMERESFEDVDTAAYMNEHFVNIKIDREERPDLDHIYMDAIQAMTGSGGWPLNVFLTPDCKPFYGGTYFPPKPAFNRASWKDVLTGVANAFREKRNEIDAQAENLTHYITQSNSFGQQKIEAAAVDFENTFSKEKATLMFTNIMQMADKQEGGFGKAPKFPQTFTIQYLLHYYYHTKNTDALNQACLSLDKMVQGGIYDQVGGGFARYSTDAEWLAPHFEKMLYDNALLVIVLCEAYQVTQKPLYKRAIEQTLAFVEKELTDKNGGFYSALDADSEGVEGKFYTWSKAEIEAVLGKDAAVFCEFFDVTEQGNWEHQNILNIRVDLETFAEQKNIPATELLAKLDECREKLYTYRQKRVAPALDDKILLGWNALMSIALCKAFGSTGNEKYKQLAVRNIDFIVNNFSSAGGTLHHTFKNGVAKYPAFLDDYTYLIQALLCLQEVTGDSGYLYKARSFTELVLDNFSESDTGFFFYTHKDQQDVIVRKKEVYDGAVPSGNAVMAINLYYLGILFDNQGWRERSVLMCSQLSQAVNRYPTSFGVWATMQLALTYSIPEIAVIGGNLQSVLVEILRIFIPFRILQSSPVNKKDNNSFPLLAHKPYTPNVQIYLCKNYTCQNPVTEATELLEQLDNV